MIEINLPDIASLPDAVSLTGAAAIAILFGVSAALVVGAGVPLAFLYVLLSKQVTTISESQEYQEHLASLEKRQKEQLGRLNEHRGAASSPRQAMPRWSAVSTSIVILLFAMFFGMLVDGTLVPDGTFEMGGRLVDSTLPVVGGFAVVTLIILAWRMRPQRLDSFEAEHAGPIPWDFIWVLLTGLLVVGLGIGALVYFNIPA